MCARLRRLGVDARPAGSKQWVEEGLIDVAEGPIRQVWMSHRLLNTYGDFSHDETETRIDYLVPDSRIGPNFSTRGVHFVGGRWEEETKDKKRSKVSWAELMSRLSQDNSVYERPNLEIRVDPERSCWVITEGARGGIDPASSLQWNLYQRIASHLLAAAVLVDRHSTERACAVLLDLGVDARVVEQDPFTKEPRVQIADDPIRWIELALGALKAGTHYIDIHRDKPLGFGALCYVPDARIAPDSPKIGMVSVRVKSFPLFGRVKRVRWEVAGPSRHSQRAKDFSLSISESLVKDPAATEATKSCGTELCIRTDPNRGCWILAADDRPMWKWTRQLWDCCQAVAERLLAMPFASSE